MNKFIGIKFSIGCMLWPWCYLIQDRPPWLLLKKIDKMSYYLEWSLRSLSSSKNWIFFSFLRGLDFIEVYASLNRHYSKINFQDLTSSLKTVGLWSSKIKIRQLYIFPRIKKKSVFWVYLAIKRSRQQGMHLVQE